MMLLNNYCVHLLSVKANYAKPRRLKKHPEAEIRIRPKKTGDYQLKWKRPDTPQLLQLHGLSITNWEGCMALKTEVTSLSGGHSNSNSNSMEFRVSMKRQRCGTQNPKLHQDSSGGQHVCTLSFSSSKTSLSLQSPQRRIWNIHF